MEEKDREEIYKRILELEDGNEKERSLAFKCDGILSNDSTLESYEDRLNIVKQLLDENDNK